MPSIDDEAEFELLDSIFADIDEATLSGLSQTKAKVPTKQNNVHTAKSYTSTAVKAGLNNVKKQTQREPLGPGRSNVLSSLSQASRGKQAATNASLKPSLGQLPTKTKVYSQTSAATSASPSRAWKSTGAIKPIPTKPAKTSALPNNKPFQRTSQAALVLKPQPTVAHFKPKEDDDLLAGIDWSDDEAPSLESQSQKSRKIDKGKAKEITEPDVETLARIKTQADPNYVGTERGRPRRTQLMCSARSTDPIFEALHEMYRIECNGKGGQRLSSRKGMLISRLMHARLSDCLNPARLSLSRLNVLKSVEGFCFSTNGQRQRWRRVSLRLSHEGASADRCIAGDIVNVIGDFVTKPAPCSTPSTSAIGPEDDLPTCTLSYSSSNLFILLPDTLISATRASDAHFCRRKAVIQEKIRSSSDATPALVYGNLLHELFQSCFLAMAEPSDASLADKIAEAFSLARREAEIDRLLKLPKNIESLFTIHVELDEARNHLREKSVTFTDFARQFLGQTPKVWSSQGPYAVAWQLTSAFFK